MVESDQETALRKAREAKMKLDEAARALGYDTIHDVMMHEGDDPEEVPADALRALTNAYSWLDNGMVEQLN